MGEAIELYKEKLRNDPADAESLLALGNCLKAAGRLERAEKCFRDCVSVDPRCAEAWLSRAHLLNQMGDFEECFNCLKQGLAYRDSWTFHRLQNMTPTQFGASYAEFYNDMGRILGKKEAPAMHPSFLSKRKVGRNDPCPCGSGKKYKKCCLGKE